MVRIYTTCGEDDRLVATRSRAAEDAVDVHAVQQSPETLRVRRLPQTALAHLLAQRARARLQLCERRAVARNVLYGGQREESDEVI